MGIEVVSSRRVPELREIFGNEDFSFHVPREFSAPGSLAVFIESQTIIKNEFFLNGTIPILNSYDHFGQRYVDLSGRRDGEGLTFNEFFFVELESKKRTGRFVSEGRWIKLSGSLSPRGQILLATISSNGWIACSYDDGKIKYPEPLSLPKP